MCIKNIAFIVFLFFSLPLTVGAKEVTIDATTKEVCNQVITNIYRDILHLQDKYKELTDFGEGAFYANKYGIYAIVYEYRPKPQAEDKEKSQSLGSFSFGVTIDGLDDDTFGQRVGQFALGFPLLGLKFSGYQQSNMLRSKFELLPLVQKHGILLDSHQQNLLPLRLFLRPVKETFKVREDIQFEVVLTNVSKSNLVVKTLNNDNLSFYINDRIWGVGFDAQDSLRPVIEPWVKLPIGGTLLKAGESVKMTLRGESFQYPKEVMVRAIYEMAIDGINPTAELKVRVVK